MLSLSAPRLGFSHVGINFLVFTTFGWWERCGGGVFFGVIKSNGLFFSSVVFLFFFSGFSSFGIWFFLFNKIFSFNFSRGKKLFPYNKYSFL